MITDYYPNILTSIVAGLLVIGFGILIGNILSVVSKKILQSFEVEKVMQNWGVKFPIEEFIGSIVKYGIYIGGLVLGLGFLGLQTFVLYIILISLLVILVIFIVLSLKDFFPNFISGLRIHFKNKIKNGDLVEIEHVEGRIIDAGLLETHIKTEDGDIVIMPNMLISKNIITKKKR
jgi:small-conductance mechanosensitive channel